MTFLLLSIGFAGNATSSQSHNTVQEDEEQDSVINIVGWFNNHDTLEYTIDATSWKVTGEDTVETSCISAMVRIAVTDSTETGYKLEYTFINIENNMDETDRYASIQNRLIEIDKKINRNKNLF